MSKVPPELAQIAELARRNKAAAHRKGDPDATIWHLVDFERDGKRVMRVSCCDAEDMYYAVTEGVPALAADAVCLAVDVWSMQSGSPTDPRNPVSGQPLRLGDMDEIAKEDLGVERGLMQELLQFVRVDRSGTWRIVSLPYENDRAARRIKWGEAEEMDVGAARKLAAQRGHGMRMVDLIDEAFAAPTAASVLGRATKDHEKDLVASFQDRRDREFAIGIDSLVGFNVLEARL